MLLLLLLLLLLTNERLSSNYCDISESGSVHYTLFACSAEGQYQSVCVFILIGKIFKWVGGFLSALLSSPEECRLRFNDNNFPPPPLFLLQIKIRRVPPSVNIVTRARNFNGAMHPQRITNCKVQLLPFFVPY